MDTMSWFPIAGVITAGVLAVIAIYILLLRLTSVKLPGGNMVRRKKDASLAIGALLLVIAVMGGAINEMQGWIGTQPGTITPPGPDQLPSGCPDTGFTNVSIDVQNSLNTSGVEEFDVGMTCVGPHGLVAISDTTNGAGRNFVCGDSYTCYVTSTAGAAGDGSVVQSILSGSGSISGGQLVLPVSGAAQTLQVGIDQIGVTGAKMWDKKLSGWIYDTGDASTAEYETDGTTFESTTNNATALAVGDSGEVSVELYFRSTAVDQALNDGRGILFAVDAAVTVWQEPTIKLDGASLTDCKDSLSSDEKIAMSGYEYVYCYTGSKSFAQNNEGVLGFQVFALSGVNPGAGDDLQIDIVPRGQEASSKDATKFIQSAYDDSSTRAVVLQVDDYTLDIS